MQLGQKQLQMLDLTFPREQLLGFGDQFPMFAPGSAHAGFRGKDVQILERGHRHARRSHELTRFHPARARKSCGKNLARYTDNCGVQVRSGRRQSMPSSSIDNCARVNKTVPLVACGDTKRPRSSRLAFAFKIGRKANQNRTARETLMSRFGQKFSGGYLLSASYGTSRLSVSKGYRGFESLPLRQPVWSAENPRHFRFENARNRPISAIFVCKLDRRNLSRCATKVDIWCLFSDRHDCSPLSAVSCGEYNAAY
jgi:hypothetical protein